MVALKQRIQSVEQSWKERMQSVEQSRLPSRLDDQEKEFSVKTNILVMCYSFLLLPRTRADYRVMSAETESHTEAKHLLRPMEDR